MTKTRRRGCRCLAAPLAGVRTEKKGKESMELTAYVHQRQERENNRRGKAGERGGRDGERDGERGRENTGEKKIEQVSGKGSENKATVQCLASFCFYLSKHDTLPLI